MKEYGSSSGVSLPRWGCKTHCDCCREFSLSFSFLYTTSLLLREASCHVMRTSGSLGRSPYEKKLRTEVSGQHPARPWGPTTVLLVSLEQILFWTGLQRLWSLLTAWLQLPEKPIPPDKPLWSLIQRSHEMVSVF